MNKEHRVVLSASAFQRIAHMLNVRAVECAENEGWLIPAEAAEPLLAMAQAGAMRRAVATFHQHMRDELHFWSGRTGAQRRAKAHDAVPSSSPAGPASAHVAP